MMDDDVKRFASCVNDFVARYGEEALSDEFGVSLPSIRRWAAGKNAPHRVMRPFVIRWIAEKLAGVAQR
jgi:hypothetical protein